MTPRTTGREVPAAAPVGAPRLLAVVGPTASGKSALALAVATSCGGEIISADSQQIYRGLDIGTAKPTAEERRRVPHHLVDVAEPTEVWSAGEFVRRADEAILQMAGRGSLPIIVGGTGLWVRALLYGIAAAPSRDDAVRARLEEEAARSGREALHARLAELDPETAAGIAPQNLTRVVRALEIHALTGERPSALRARHGFGRLRYHARVVGLSPPREELYRRIDARVLAMYGAGLLDEVRGLVARGLAGAPALRALGYPQAIDALEGRTTVEEAIARTAQVTRRYAKRQLTWFRAEPTVEWLGGPPDGGVADALARWGRG